MHHRDPSSAHQRLPRFWLAAHTHPPTNRSSQWRAGACRAVLQETAGLQALQIIGRAKGHKVAVDRDYVVERQHIGGRVYTQKQPEGCFSQPNGEMCLEMVAWAQQAVQGSSGDCLELYCGSGNFTVPLARHFGQVVATEVRTPSRQGDARDCFPTGCAPNVHGLTSRRRRLLRASACAYWLVGALDACSSNAEQASVRDLQTHDCHPCHSSCEDRMLQCCTSQPAMLAQRNWLLAA